MQERRKRIKIRDMEFLRMRYIALKIEIDNKNIYPWKVTDGININSEGINASARSGTLNSSSTSKQPHKNPSVQSFNESHVEEGYNNAYFDDIIGISESHFDNLESSFVKIIFLLFFT